MTQSLAIISGAGGGGIGTAIALEMVASHYDLLCIERTEQASHFLRHHLPIPPSNILVGNVADEQIHDILRNKLQTSEWSRVVAIHNAARGAPIKEPDEISLSEFSQDINDIIVGGFLIARTIAPLVRKQKNSRMIFIGSSAALHGTRGRGLSYATAKAALHGMSCQLAIHFAPYQATSNVVIPYQTMTPRVLRDNRKTKEQLEQFGNLFVPLGRVGRPSDVASLVRFLASLESGYMTGQVLELDGGQMLAPDRKLL